nr:hypothetical protein [Tanacetum cinerariifolium]
WCGDIAFKNLVPRLYALESMKNIEVASKLSYGGLEFSFRRNPKGGVEHAQFERLKEMVEGVTLSNSNDRWSWSLVGSGGFSVSSVTKLIDNAILPKGISKTRLIKERNLKIFGQEDPSMVNVYDEVHMVAIKPVRKAPKWGREWYGDDENECFRYFSEPDDHSKVKNVGTCIGQASLSYACSHSRILAWQHDSTFAAMVGIAFNIGVFIGLDIYHITPYSTSDKDMIEELADDYMEHLVQDSKTHTVGGVRLEEYMDHGFTKSMSELDRCYTMLQELRFVIVGGALIHKNREGSKHEGIHDDDDDAYFISLDSRLWVWWFNTTYPSIEYVVLKVYGGYGVSMSAVSGQS